MCHHGWPCFIFLRIALILLVLLAFPGCTSVAQDMVDSGCLSSCQATLGSWPKCSIRALTIAWSEKNKTVWLFDRWKIARNGLANWASRVASLAFSLRWMAAVLKRVPELALRQASGLVWLDQQNVIAYHCSFGPLLIVDGLSWLSVGLLST